ncbi:MAG: GNAT family N-acetyltransferase [Aestuariivirgaceae bacterium]|nr:GNAT family N-acetyltransferase [Aestuariivirgaceae bacterium]
MENLASKSGLNARLAQTASEREQAFALRHEIFAPPGKAGRDEDIFDAACDHLLLIAPHEGPIGTCRLLRQCVAQKAHGFYSATEFDVAPLLARHPGHEFLEIGRTCIRESHRTGPAAALMWQAIWNYVRIHKLTVMMGCASLEGTNPQAHETALGFLAAHCPPPLEWQVRGISGRGIPITPKAVSSREALRALPPLLKAYLRIGAWVGPEAVIDADFGTTDVFVTLPVSRIDPRYFGHFGEPGQLLIS